MINNKWNISKKNGESIIHHTIIKALKHTTNNEININDLITLINQETKHIIFINNKQRKPISTYIHRIYGNLTSFLDKYLMYGIIKKHDGVYITLINEHIPLLYKHMTHGDPI